MFAVAAATWRVLIELAPWLLLGTLLGGVLHVVLPAGWVARAFRGRWGVLAAVAVGVPLPLCSCGVIPAGLALKRDGASTGATVGFLIATPQSGLDSVLVGSAFLGWPFALYRVLVALLTGLAGGLLAETLVVDAPPAEDAAACGKRVERRTLRAFFDHVLMLLRSIWRWLAIGIVASGLLTVVVPAGALSGLSTGGTLLAMLATLVIAVPLYVCATASIPIAAALVAAGLPAGAALVFLTAGPATNVATLGAVARTLGLRALWVYLGTIVVGSMAAGLVFDAVFGSFAAAASARACHDRPASWFETASALTLVGLMAWFAFEELSGWARSLARAAHGGATAMSKSIELTVNGMTCGGCVTRLDKVLRREPGVDDVVVTLEPGRAVVRGEVTAERVRALIESAGFDVA